MFVIVTYDVSADRTEIFRKLLGRYLVHEQASVFAGILTETAHRRMQHEIAQVTRPEDRLLEFRVLNRHNLVAIRLAKSPTNGALQEIGITEHASSAMVI